jgi:hypothetical protein
MSKYKITIIVKSDADPNSLLEAALETGSFFENETSEECKVDADKTSVEESE